MDSITATVRFQMLGQLAHAVRRTHELQQFISRQRAHIQVLRRGRYDTFNEELVLSQLEKSQKLYESDCERLEIELESLSKRDTRLRRECRGSGP
jgi:hypothetical protein